MNTPPNDLPGRQEEHSFNEQVTVKCNQCGAVYCFFPMRILSLRECKCGNSDWGSPRGWWNNNFGNFTLVKREEIIFNI